MFRRLMKNKKAQNTAEYAILISLVVAGIIAMQTYAQRALQARVRDAGAHLATATNGIGETQQYEPYYLSTNYQIDSDTSETTKQGYDAADLGKVRKEVDNTRTRALGGTQTSTYDQTQFVSGNEFTAF